MTIGHSIYGGGRQKVFVLHGWFSDSTVFEPMLPYLDTDQFSYAFVDYRGYGRSRSQAGNYSMAEISGDVRALAETLGWSRYHLVGHSMGGMAIQRVLVDAPKQVISAVALTPVPASGVPLDEQSKPLFGGAADNDQNRRGILDFTTGGRLSAVWLDWMVRRSRETTTRDAFAAYLTAWTESNFANEVQGLETPMLVCVGEHDGALTAEVMRATYLAWLPNARLEVIPNAGHYPMQETPVHLATLIERFIAEHAG